MTRGPAVVPVAPVADGNGTQVRAAMRSPTASWPRGADVDALGAPLEPEPESAVLTASLAETFTAAQGLLHGDEGAVDLDRLLCVPHERSA